MLSKLFSLFFPPNEDEKIIETLANLNPSLHTVTTSQGIKIFTCTKYNEPNAHSAIKLLKHYGNNDAAKLFAKLLSDVLSEELSTMRIWNSKDIGIILIPTTKKRIRERGFSPLEEVCKFLPEELRSLLIPNILIQTKNIPMQKTLSRKERFKNVKGIFYVTNQSKIKDKHLIIIDDVTTTGATLSEAVKTLTKSGATVTAMALARA